MLKKKSVRWFLMAGCIGVAVAIVLLIIKPANPALILFLCPTAIVGLADPKTLIDKTATAIVIFGGNFLLYGVFGGIASLAADSGER